MCDTERETERERKRQRQTERGRIREGKKATAIRGREEKIGKERERERLIYRERDDCRT